MKNIGRSLLVIKIIAGLLLAWLVIAYLIAPAGWRIFARYDPDFDSSPRITEAGDRHPGDPLNVAFVGSEARLREVMTAAEWFQAARLGLKSDLEIAADTILSRPDNDAPVSSLFLFGRKEDLAFEQPVGNSPRHRHHVRLWKIDEADNGQATRWIGSAVYDERVGLSETTGQITHITAADVDAERDYLFSCIEKTGLLSGQLVVHGFHTQLEGRNGGGDRWRTDGNLSVGILKASEP
jgi:hypothetical protein